jgi:hypothetical protein
MSRIRGLRVGWISLIEHSCLSFCFLWFLFCLCAGEDLPLSSGDTSEDC